MQSTALLGGCPLLAARPRATRPTQRSSRIIRAVAEREAEAVPFLSDADHLAAWGRESWRNFPALQQPNYPDKARVVARGPRAVGGMLLPLPPPPDGRGRGATLLQLLRL